MTIINGHLSKQLVLYPPSQLSIEHDLPIWLEDEEEDVSYHTMPYLVCTLDIVIGRRKLNEDGLINHILHNQPPTPILVDELMKETESNPWTGLCSLESSLGHVKIVEVGPSRTIKINHSLLAKKEEQVCNVLRQHLDDFAWDYKEMKGVHPLVCIHHMYIKEG